MDRSELQNFDLKNLLNQMGLLLKIIHSYPLLKRHYELENLLRNRENIFLLLHMRQSIQEWTK